MKYLNQLLILGMLSLPAWSFSSELVCLRRMCRDTSRTEDEVSRILMYCSIKIMEGERIYLNAEYKAKRIQLYPNEDGVMGEFEKARRILEYNECINVTHLVAMYLERCNTNITRRKP